MPDEFTTDPANHEMQPEDAATQQIHDRLLTLGTQWRSRHVPTGRLSAHLRSLVASEHLKEASNGYPLQEEFVLVNAPATQSQQTPSPRRYLIPAIAAALVIALLGATFIFAARKGPATYSLIPTATSGITTTGVATPTATTTSATVTATPVLPVSTTPLIHVQMIDTTTGWATDDIKIYHTTDGGQNWHNVTPAGVVPVNPHGGPLSLVITALNDTTAWFSDGQKIYRTTDSGQTWQPSSPPVQGSISDLTFVDTLHGWAVDFLDVTAGQEHLNLLHTTDGGASWTQIASTERPGNGGLSASTDTMMPVFLNATTGWIGGSVPENNYIDLFVTHDGGVTWRPQSLPLPTSQTFQSNVTSMTFFDARNGALSLDVTPTSAMTGVQYFYVTHDGGASWSIAGSPQPYSFGPPDFLDANHWWLLHGSELNITGDGGQHWTTVTPGGAYNNAVEKLDFISTTTGWAYNTSTPLLLQTTDGGHTWQKITLRAG